MIALMNYAQEWTDSHCTVDYIPEDPTNAGDVLFATKYNKIRSYRTWYPIGEFKRKQCSACVLTRWMYVGSAANYGWQYSLFYSSSHNLSLTDTVLITSRIWLLLIYRV